jgi:hypothetical protein
MAGKCKACHTPLQSEIDDRLRRGDTCESVAEWVTGQGTTISATSINRHRNDHVDGIKTPVKRVKTENYDDMPPIVDIGAYIENLTAEINDLDVTTNIGKERKITQVLLERGLQKQLVLVNQLQDDYANCKGSYPDSQIRGLKLFFDMVNTLPTYENRKVMYQLQADKEKAAFNKIEQYVIDFFNSCNGENEIVIPYKLINEYVTTCKLSKYDLIERKEMIEMLNNTVLEDYQLLILNKNNTVQV